MLQEMMALHLDVDLGEYYQYVGSMHIYDNYVEAARQYITEGHQKAVEMPAMPAGDPFEIVKTLLDAEARIRRGETIDAAVVTSEPYWADLIRLLQVFWASGQSERIAELKAEFAHPMYKVYLDIRRDMKPRGPEMRGAVQ